MKAIILILLPFISVGQVATIQLKNGKAIVNAPSGRDWTDYSVVPGGIIVHDNKMSIIDDSQVNEIKYSGKWRISKNNKY